MRGRTGPAFFVWNWICFIGTTLTGKISHFALPIPAKPDEKDHAKQIVHANVYEGSDRRRSAGPCHPIFEIPEEPGLQGFFLQCDRFPEES